MATPGIPHIESHSEFKYVFWCTVCHVRAVAVGDDAKQLVELLERAEAGCNEKEMAALHTCESCRKALCQG